MLSDEEFDRALRDADPVRGRTDGGFDEAAAASTLSRARRRAGRARTRRLVVMPVVALAVVGATAGTYAWVAGDGRGHALDALSVDCVRSATADATFALDAAREDPVGVCEGAWKEAFGTAPPERLTACVDSSGQGSIKVYPGGREQCARHRADPYRGASAEQRRLAEFRADLRDRFADRGCTSFPATADLIRGLLAEHGLTGWKPRTFRTADEAAGGPCAEISYYDGKSRTVWLGDRDPGADVNYV